MNIGPKLLVNFSYLRNDHDPAQRCTVLMLAGKRYKLILISWDTRADTGFATICAQVTPVAAHRPPQRSTVHDTAQHQRLARLRGLLRLCFRRHFELVVQIWRGRRPATRTFSPMFALLTPTTRPYCLWTWSWRKCRSSASSQRRTWARTSADLNWWSISCILSVQSRTRPCGSMSSTTLSRCRPSCAISWHWCSSSSSGSPNCCRIASRWCSTAGPPAQRTTWPSLFPFKQKTQRGIHFVSSPCRHIKTSFDLAVMIT